MFWHGQRRLRKATSSTFPTAAISVTLVREVADTGRYNFAHALIQRTLYEDLGPNRRGRAHRHVGEALDALCGDRPGARVGELARHWFSAHPTPSTLAKAIDYSRQAGDAALNALAPADALRYYSQALELYARDDHAADPRARLGNRARHRATSVPGTRRFGTRSSARLGSRPTSATRNGSSLLPGRTTAGS